MSERRRQLGYAFLSLVLGACLPLATPPWNQPLFAFVSLMGLYGTMRESARDGWMAWCYGVGANLVALRFVPRVIVSFTPLPLVAGFAALILVAAAQALVFALAGVLVGLMRARGVPQVLAFGCSLYVASFSPQVFPWTPAGALTTWPLAVQTADIWGERGVYAALAISCAAVVEMAMAGLAILRREGRTIAGSKRVLLQGVLLAAWFAVLVGYGYRAIHDVDTSRASSVAVGLVGPHIPADARWEKGQEPWILNRLLIQTKDLERQGASLVVWTEAAYPYTLSHDDPMRPPDHRDPFRDDVHGPILAGLILRTRDHHVTNSSVVFLRNGDVTKPYDKMALLAFGEYVPLADQIPFLARWFQRGLGMKAGTENVIQEAGDVRAGILNCFEDTLPHKSREAVSGIVPANLLVNMTNDAWFDGTSEPLLHEQIARLRAIEVRRDLIRAVNGGPLGHIDAAGRIVARAETDFPKTLLVRPTLRNATTIYGRFGDRPLLILCLVLCLCTLRTRGSLAS